MAASPPGSQRSVLLVDDDDAIRESLNELLTDEGYRVIEARNGSEALQLLAAADCEPCVVLLDLMMPVMSGWQLLEALEREGLLARHRILVLSAVADRSRLPASVRGFLAKPLGLEELLGAVALHCYASS